MPGTLQYTVFITMVSFLYNVRSAVGSGVGHVPDIYTYIYLYSIYTCLPKQICLLSLRKEL